MNGFSEGYSFFEKNAGVQIASVYSCKYVDNVSSEIVKLLSSLKKFEGYSTCAKKLKGDIAEFWHAGTFNINAAVKKSRSHAEVYRSHDFASADVVVKTSKEDILFGLKYDATATTTAKEQSKSIFERYKYYKAQGGVDTLENFLLNRGYDDSTVLSDPIYQGQIRVIPKEQLQLAQQWLKRKIAKVSVTSPEQVNRYKETLELLDTKVSDNKGVMSIELTSEEAKRLAELSKKGCVSLEELEKLGVSVNDLIQYEHILKEAFKGGLTAAVVSSVLNVAPEIIKAFIYLIKTGQLEENLLKKFGGAAIKGSVEGFINGTISAALTAVCKTGLLGQNIKEINPSIIGTLTVFTMNILKNSIDVALGKKSKRDVANELVKDMFLSTCSLVMSGIMQCVIKIPVWGSLLGSFIGSVIGSFTYEIGYKGALSFCVATGFTLFGLVKQDYNLPEDVIEQIGGKVFEIKEFLPKSLGLNLFEAKKFQPKMFSPISFEIKVLQRGVVGFSIISYI